MKSAPPVCLTISVSENTGTSGSEADIKTFTALGTFGISVQTGLQVRTYNQAGAIKAVDDATLREQLEAVAETFPLAAVKVGAVATASQVRIIGRWLRERPRLSVIVDPVMTNQIGIPLAQPESIEAIKRDLLPRANLVTPNRFEAAQLSGVDEVLVVADMEHAAKDIFRQFNCATLVSSGVMNDELVDVLAAFDGISHFRSKPSKQLGRVVGTGCTFSAAITALLGRGEDLRESILASKDYIAEQITAAPVLIREPDLISPICHCQVTEHLAHADGFGVGTDTSRIQRPR